MNLTHYEGKKTLKSEQIATNSEEINHNLWLHFSLPSQIIFPLTLNCSNKVSFGQAPSQRPIVALPVPAARMTKHGKLLGFHLSLVLALQSRYRDSRVVLVKRFSLSSSGLACFLPDLSSMSLQYFGPLVHEVEQCFCTAVKLFCEMQKSNSPDSLGKFRERRRLEVLHQILCLIQGDFGYRDL